MQFSYTISLQLRDTLNTINRLRSHILSFPLNPKTEIKRTWEGLSIRIWASLSLAHFDVPKHEIATILANPVRPTHAVALIRGLRTAYDYIHEDWRANPRPVSLSALETLFTYCYPNEPRLFGLIEPSLKKLLAYIEAEEEHPVIQAAIAHIYIASIQELPDPGLFARLVHYLFLAKYGYDIRGYVTPDRTWQSDPTTYRHLIEEYGRTNTMTKWLEYVAASMQTNLEAIAGDIQESRFHIEYPPQFWGLSQRQKEIIRILDNPEATITNRQVHARFKVSQITASRDLAKLTTLGLLYPHGKGRSIYYTKI